MRGISVGRSLLLLVLALLALLSFFAAASIGRLYQSRQTYEDALISTYSLESQAGNLFALGVLEEATLQNTGADSSESSRAFDQTAGRAMELARSDSESASILRKWVIAQQRGRAAARMTPPDRETMTASFRTVRAQRLELTARQQERRAAAREKARDEARTTLLTLGTSAGLALGAAGSLCIALIRRMKKPLDELVAASNLIAGGSRDTRVATTGPSELRSLGASFNAMAEETEAAHAQVESERARLADVIEKLGDGLIVTDVEGRVSVVNPRARQFLPVEVGQDVNEAGLSKPGTGATHFDVDLNERTLSISTSTLGDNGTAWTIRDVSEKTRLERLKSDFVGSVSHELRSPLLSIKGFAELMLDSDNLTSEQREFVEVMLRSSDRLGDLVNSLLDMARIEAGEVRVSTGPVDVAEQIRLVASLLQHRLDEKKQVLTLEIAANLPPVLADAGHLQQILINLLTNAHQYTEEGKITVEAKTDGEEVVIDVIDTGRGVAPGELEHVFDRFFRSRTATDVKGTGLGLSIVKSLVELQGGSVRATSRTGEGSTFTVSLPTVLSRQEHDPPAGIQPEK